MNTYRKMASYVFSLRTRKYDLVDSCDADDVADPICLPLVGEYERCAEDMRSLP